MKQDNGYKTELKELFRLYDDEELARKLDITVRSLQNYRSGGNVTKKVIKKINETFAKAKGGATVEEPKDIKNPDHEDRDIGILSMRAITNLTESQKKISDAVDKIAAANLILARQVEGKSATARPDLREAEILNARMTVLSTFLAKIAAGHRFASYDEAIEALSSSWLGIEDQGKGQAGNRAEAGRSDISQG